MNDGPGWSSTTHGVSEGTCQNASTRHPWTTVSKRPSRRTRKTPNSTPRRTPTGRTDDYDGERHFEYYAVEEFRDAVEAEDFHIVELDHFDRGWIQVLALAP